MAKRKLNLNLEKISENAFCDEDNNSSSSFEMALTPISNAVSLSLAKKCTKIANFMNGRIDNLESDLQSLRGFSISTGGLIKDDYRKK